MSFSVKQRSFTLLVISLVTVLGCLTDRFLALFLNLSTLNFAILVYGIVCAVLFSSISEKRRILIVNLFWTP